jgi:hypothetical protein
VAFYVEIAVIKCAGIAHHLLQTSCLQHTIRGA